MKTITIQCLSLACLFVLGACTAPEKTPANAGVSPEVQQKRKFERDERFFDHGGSFK